MLVRAEGYGILVNERTSDSDWFLNAPSMPGLPAYCAYCCSNLLCSQSRAFPSPPPFNLASPCSVCLLSWHAYALSRKIHLHRMQATHPHVCANAADLLSWVHDCYVASSNKHPCRQPPAVADSSVLITRLQYLFGTCPAGCLQLQVGACPSSWTRGPES